MNEKHCETNIGYEINAEFSYISASYSRLVSFGNPSELCAVADVCVSTAGRCEMDSCAVSRAPVVAPLRPSPALNSRSALTTNPEVGLMESTYGSHLVPTESCLKTNDEQLPD